MNEEAMKSIALQLRQPQGPAGLQVAEKMNEGNRFMNRATIEALHLQVADHILEIGMGNGFFVKEILALHPTVVYSGCDYSEEMVREAGRLNAQFVNNGQASFHLTGADNLPFEGAVFDKVFTVNTLYFWEDPKAVLEGIGRVLRPGGTLIIAIRPRSSMERMPFVQYGFRMYSKEDVVALLEAHQYRVTHIAEHAEPPQELNGEQYAMEALIVTAIPAGTPVGTSPVHR